MNYQPQPGDPRNRKELDDWLKRRQVLLEHEGLPADTPLTAREYLMVQTLQSGRPPYSIM